MDRKEYQKQYRQAHKKEAAEYQKQYREANKADLAEQHRAYYLANRELLLERAKEQQRKDPEGAAKRVAEWNLANPERRKEIQKKWHKANPERVRENSRRSRRNNPEMHARSLAAWRKRNPLLQRQYAQQRRARILGSEGTITAAEVEALYGLCEGKCGACRKDLNMKYHLDHIMPLSLGGQHVIGNAQILCPKCNQMKHAMHPDDWAARVGKLFSSPA